MDLSIQNKILTDQSAISKSFLFTADIHGADVS